MPSAFQWRFRPRTRRRIEVDLATTRLKLYEDGHQILDVPAGVGRAATPTTPGSFFLAFFQEPHSAGWGPFVMVTSAHSDTISDWQESGDAIVEIHGSLDSEARIGDTGAQVSAGCIRLRSEDLAKLRDVPAGTPIEIRAAAA